jgi:PiT family inorganic phosphate transporter
MDALTTVALVAALTLALGFEFVNGFHDTANAVATVIYTRALPPWIAVIWSGLWNLTGVLLSTGAVAFGIVALLPVELVIHVGSGAGFAMVFAMLVSAIIWNVGTWYFGLPASSSHTLIGSIVGVGLMNSLLKPGHVFGDGVNWGKVQDTVTALLVSPVIGFVGAAVLLVLLKLVVKYKPLYEAPPEGGVPPWPIRILLILTCTGVSYAHGSNDGQKGMGLIMLILIGVIPGVYALNSDVHGDALAAIAAQSHAVTAIVAKTGNTSAAPASSADASADEQVLSDYVKSGGKLTPPVFGALVDKNANVEAGLAGKTSLDALTGDARKDLRTNMYLVAASLDKMVKGKVITDADDAKAVTTYRKGLDSLTKFIPNWVKVAVALALGLGTMIGWKRIVVTVGEKIGKSHLTYAQGATAELITYATIQGADTLGLPVSTTHILSSGVAGAMFANQSGLQRKTLQNILVAWVLTIPVCVFLGSMLFAGALFVVTSLGAK